MLIPPSLLVDLLRERRSEQHGPATERLQALADEQIGVCFHVACELQAGAAVSKGSDETSAVEALLSSLHVVYPDSRFPETYGKLYAGLRRRGETISAMDLLIATAAVVEEATLVTRNARDFRRVPGLTVETY